MKQSSKIFKPLVGTLLTLMAILLVYIFSTQHLIVSGLSMMPTYNNGTKLTGLRFFLSIRRGDIVIYTPPQQQCEDPKQQCFFVARVIGLPNEKLEMANYFVKINDKTLEEKYLAPNTHTLFSDKVGGTFVMKNDEYFVMADNRPYGDDSRMFGPIKRSQITSKIIW